MWLGVRLVPSLCKTTIVKEPPKRCKADGMRIDDTERINTYELEVELRTGKPRQRKEWSGEARLGTFKAATRL
jgi:hypothetical protein